MHNQDAGFEWSGEMKSSSPLSVRFHSEQVEVKYITVKYFYSCVTLIPNLEELVVELVIHFKHNLFVCIVILRKFSPYQRLSERI